jgi:sugar phosphate isomerase/epimerase
MKIKYFAALWGMNQPTLEANLRLIKESGFDGVEMGIPSEPSERTTLRTVLNEYGLELIAQQWTDGVNPDEHAESFTRQYNTAAEFEPLFVNSHTGKDYFSLDENLIVFRRAAALEEQTGIRVLHETHRGRGTFSATHTSMLIGAMPDIKLTADFSHWCCVHESLLEDQEKMVTRAIERSYHIHARVGHAEGPQVTDPRAPEWKRELDVHKSWWRRIVESRRKEGLQYLTVCPEFGPPAYLTTLPYTGQPIVNLWEVNVYMKDLLRQHLAE